MFYNLLMVLVLHILQVEDKQLSAGEFEDVSKVEKFELSEEEYSKRSGIAQNKTWAHCKSDAQPYATHHLISCSSVKKRFA